MSENNLSPNNPTPSGVDPIKLLQQSPILWEKLYTLHGDLWLKLIAAAFYIAASVLLLFYAPASVAAALGLSIVGGIFSFLGALCDYHRVVFRHKMQLEKMQAAINELPENNQKRRGLQIKFKALEHVGYRYFRYPGISLALSAASSSMLNIIALLNLIGIIAADANLAQPYVLLGLVILNGIFLAIKDLILNKCIEANRDKLKNLSEEISDSLKNEREELIKGFLPTAVQDRLKAPLPVLNEIVRVESSHFSRIASAHTPVVSLTNPPAGTETLHSAETAATPASPPELGSPDNTANTPSTPR